MNLPDLSGLFSSKVKTACHPIRNRVTSLYPEENEVVQNAVQKRRNEFHSSRQCAREALKALGFPLMAILKDEDRKPIWPDKVVGAITHSGEICAAAVALKEELAGVGVDIEQVGRMKSEIQERVLNPEEIQRKESSELDSQIYATVIYSAKESLFKALYPMNHHWFGFEDASLELDTETGSFKASLCHSVSAGLQIETTLFSGSYLLYEQWVCTGLEIHG